MTDEDLVKSCAEKLIDWCASVRRELPWRLSPTPYNVWVSEIMLQQTRIEAVIPYYARFLEALPDIRALAEVDEDKLLKLWEGLGYYSRARNLQRAAKRVMAEAAQAYTKGPYEKIYPELDKLEKLKARHEAHLEEKYEQLSFFGKQKQKDCQETTLPHGFP